VGVRPPTTDQLLALARQCGLSVDASEIAYYQRMLVTGFESHQLLDGLPDEVPPVRYARTPGYAPSADEDPHHIWYRKTAIQGAPEGPLRGKRIALKDNIQLAGVAMMNGSSLLEGFVPEFDATIVTRMLDAGAEIAGKVHCENLCMSGGSYTNASGPVHNPHRRGYSAGGSSSGSAAVIAAGEADMAIGGDQGGSIRLPASQCGIVGMKPTYGLVPYTGIMPIEISLDHAGPMTANVADNALLLEVIAGDDGVDPRQRSPQVHRYTEALGRDVAGMRVALLREGFEIPTMEAVVNDCVRAAAQKMRSLGVQVTEVSMPVHAIAGRLSAPILAEGALRTLFWGDGWGSSRSDIYSLALMDHFRAWRQRADELSDAGKLMLLSATHVANQHGGRYYAKAMNVMRRVRAGYDELLQSHDLLLMPTTPMRATPLPQPGADREATLKRFAPLSANTRPFNVTHHPAMSVPCGMADGLPVGMMLVGRHFDEPAIYRLAHAFEQAHDWTRH
jgi:amidase